MINFFRKKRKTLADENPSKSRAGKTLKYARYAIGEIVLVVVGILIALSINNWNELRKEKLKSKVYSEKIVSDLISDTLNINSLIKDCNNFEHQAENYFSYFNKGGIPLDKLIDSSRNINQGYVRYIPVNYTFLDMQSSGNLNLLNEKQKNILIELSLEQKQIQIIIEKVISSSIQESAERNKYIGYPIDFFEKLGSKASKENKKQWLLHQHLAFRKNLDLYYYVKRRGQRIIEKSKEAILILKDITLYEQ